MTRRRAIAALLVTAAVALAGCRTGTVDHVVDGDTVDVNGERVRIIGIDTPERGDCGFNEAKQRVEQLVGGREVAVITVAGHDERDRYGRELGYITFNQTDLGTVLLAEGLAHARYDGLDGYDRHPRQDAYRALDASTPNLCG
ncbi:thermonuclease family protein [Dermatobacter hominis]|uniref:thermonuclease family protein n=1 Tax=Dermatobacter hominis TaxID=2884263 RepID=UPI001D125CB9|nr:thermonuclease family protein [Dermatobacter hominis]UDY36281.1 thermonuclease family protein [Dermatobacter hominis]